MISVPYVNKIKTIISTLLDDLKADSDSNAMLLFQPNVLNTFLTQGQGYFYKNIFERNAKELLNLTKNVDVEKLSSHLERLKLFDSAMRGGINFNADKMNLHLQNSGQSIKFKVDHVILKQLHDASGFTPVIINIQPMHNLKLFLGIKEGTMLLSTEKFSF